MAHGRSEILTAVRDHLRVTISATGGNVFGVRGRSHKAPLPFLVVGADSETINRSTTQIILSRSLLILIQVVASSEQERDDVALEVEGAMESIPGLAKGILHITDDFGVRLADGDQEHFIAALRYRVIYKTDAAGLEP